MEPLELSGRPLGVKGAVLREGLDEQAVVLFCFRNRVFLLQKEEAKGEQERKKRKKKKDETHKLIRLFTNLANRISMM